MNIRSLELCFITMFITMLGLGISATTFAQGINVNQGILTGLYVKNNTGEDYNLVLFGTHCMQWLKVNEQELKTAVPFPKNSKVSITLNVDRKGGFCAYEGSATILVSKTKNVYGAVATLNLSGQLKPGTSLDYKQCEMSSKIYGHQKTTLDVDRITYPCKITLSKAQ